MSSLLPSKQHMQPHISNTQTVLDLSCWFISFVAKYSVIYCLLIASSSLVTWSHFVKLPVNFVSQKVDQLCFVSLCLKKFHQFEGILPLCLTPRPHLDLASAFRCDGWYTSNTKSVLWYLLEYACKVWIKQHSLQFSFKGLIAFTLVIGVVSVGCLDMKKLKASDTDVLVIIISVLSSLHLYWLPLAKDGTWGGFLFMLCVFLGP